ncbi:DNA-binding protein (plasmid) [Pedobacter sp. BS3]|uniref:DNA-binding protein n=1 Tax=Pedobacter sp. BS3 TaxID=2567937 RepID=UPI0011EF6520|nr:DNA-binding protein [Pedobacter sp. BS3]TZF85820.1 DNA-binding protein [Pedobacter sp. BS3]
MYKLLLPTLLLVTTALSLYSQTIPTSEAYKHKGETVTVCDSVYGTKYFDKSGITLLNLGARYPDSPLTVMIPKEARELFSSAPETTYFRKRICVTGEVIEYKGKPEIVVKEVKQILVK